MKKLLLVLAALFVVTLPVRAQIEIPPALKNASSTGTSVAHLVKITGAPSTAIIASAGDADGAIGICDTNCGTSGFPNIATAGIATCAFDAATTAGDWVQISTSVNGDCTDTGSATIPTTGEIVGRVLNTIGSAGNAQVLLLLTQPGGGGGGGAGFPSFAGNAAGNCVEIATNGTQQLIDAGFGCANIPATAPGHSFWGNNGETTGPANGYIPIGTSDITPKLFCVAGGTTNAYTAPLTPAATALTQGLLINFLPNAANTNTTPTLNPSSLGAVTIVKSGGLPVVPGDLSPNQIATIIYDGTNFELINPATTRSMWPCAPQNSASDTVSSGTSPTETLFATVCKIPASTFITGRVIHGVIGLDYTATATIPNFTFTMMLCPSLQTGTPSGCKNLYKSTTTAPSAGTFGVAMPFTIQATSAASGTATVSNAISSGVGANSPFGRNTLASTVGNVPTNGDLYIQFSATFSTNAATNSMTLTNLEFF